MRYWLLLALSVIAMAAAVLYASSIQRTTAETNAAEQRAAERLLSWELFKERGVTNYGATGMRSLRQPYFRARKALPAELSAAFELSSDDAEETAQLRLMQQADREFENEVRDDISGRPGQAELRRETLQRHRLVAAFVKANVAYRDRLAEVGREEVRSASYVPFEVVLLLGAIFGGVGSLAIARVQRRRRRKTRIDERQNRFGEAMQVSRSQPEAHDLLRRHTELLAPDSSATVLNRNNSADRLEATCGASKPEELLTALEHSEPRACLAVRLSRPFERGANSKEVLECGLCGKLAGESTCQPLLVGGEVIGSLLVEHRGGVTPRIREQITDSVTRAAPVLANLRNLAIAEARAATDALTGLPNRRSADETLKRMIAQAGRSLEPLAAVAVDLDRFKEINDTYGHDRGDQALARFADLIGSSLRASDFAARSGGEEFLVLLPATGREGALAVAEKLREETRDLHVDGSSRSLSASFGVAVYPDDAIDGPALVRAADRALYAAKQNGRDRVEVAATPGDSRPA